MKFGSWSSYVAAGEPGQYSGGYPDDDDKPRRHSPPNCSFCGRFVDCKPGSGARFDFTPDSHFTVETAEWFMLDLAGRVVTPRPGQPKIKLQLSSDGFAAYPGAVDLAFADTVDYGVIIKDFKEDGKEAPGRYGPPEMTGTKRQCVTGAFDPYSICTSYAERNNLTIRTFLRRFTRLSLGFSKKFENLVAAVCLHMAHYNFCRRHGTLKMTPAMAAGVTGELWDLERLVREIGL